MSNIPSLPDLETDNFSFLASFQSIAPVGIDIESGGKSGRYSDGESSPGTPSKHPDGIRTIIPESGDIYQVVDDIETDLDPFSTTANDDDNAIKMTVAKDIQEVQQQGQKPADEQLDIAGKATMFPEPAKTKQQEDIRMMQLVDDFPAMTVSDTAYGTGSEDDVLEDWDDLEYPDDDGDTLLHRAIIVNNPGLARPLIQLMTQLGHDLNSQNLLFQTALHLSVITAQMDVVKELVDHGADVTVRDKYGRTPFHIACELHRPDFVNCLMAPMVQMCAVGLDRPKLKHALDIKNYEGEACVHIAAKRGDVDMMKCLVHHGANGNLADEKSGRTALHFAAENNDADMVRYLLGVDSIHASPETLTEETPILLAYLRDFDEVVELFQAHRNT